MMVAAPAIEDAWLAECRAVEPGSGAAAVTRLPGILIARYRGESGAAAREYFTPQPLPQRGGILPRGRAVGAAARAGTGKPRGRAAHLAPLTGNAWSSRGGRRTSSWSAPPGCSPSGARRAA